MIGRGNSGLSSSASGEQHRNLGSPRKTLFPIPYRQIPGPLRDVPGDTAPELMKGIQRLNPIFLAITDREPRRANRGGSRESAAPGRSARGPWCPAEALKPV